MTPTIPNRRPKTFENWIKHLQFAHKCLVGSRCPLELNDKIVEHKLSLTSNKSPKTSK